jgi:adenylate cyclase
VTLKQVGRDLGVRYVLEGSVRKAGNRLRITAQLIDAMTDHHVWAERYDRDLEDIFAVQDEVARNVASALTVALKPEEGERLSRTPTENIEAYDIFLRTRAALWPPTRENLLTARSAYRRITEIDPSFAGGHAGQSMTHAFSVMFGHSERPEEDARLALELANAAVALDDGFAHAHSALGLGHTAMGQHDEAIVCARRAVELQPGDADAHLFSAFTLMFAGQAEDAHEAITTALRLDPQYVNGPYLNVLGIVCFFAERYEEAIGAFKRNVDRGGPLGAPAVAFRTAAYCAAGQMEEAKESAQALLSFFPGFSLARFRMLHMFKNPEDTERIIGALRKAGVPE